MSIAKFITLFKSCTTQVSSNVSFHVIGKTMHSKSKVKCRLGNHQKAARKIHEEILNGHDGLLLSGHHGKDRCFGFLRKNRGKFRQRTNIKRIKKTTAHIQVLKGDSFMYVNWGEMQKGPILKPMCKGGVPGKQLPTTDFCVIDSTTTENVAIIDEESGQLICCKLSKRQACDVPESKWGEFRELLNELPSLKPNIARGKQRHGSNNRYVCFGYRKNPLGTNVGTYCFKTNVKSDTQRRVEKGIGEMVATLENVASRMIRRLPETEEFMKVKKAISLPTVSQGEKAFHIPTQFSVGWQYWSSVHVDKDFFYTLLSCVSPKKETDSTRLYYFVFPEYKIMVPMESCSLLWFNPVIPHSCSNPSTSDAMIFSAYVSNKTVLSTACNSFQLNGNSQA